MRAKKAEVFKAVHPIRPRRTSVRGQYGAGKVGGKRCRPIATSPMSRRIPTETFVALRLMIDNWRWAGVPFYLRTGKRLAKRSTEIAIRFKQAPLALFRDTPVDELGADWLILQIQPDEGIRLRFNAKQPGPELALESVAMDFKYADWFKQPPAVGYETLLYDCFIGDSTLFQRADQVESAWAVVSPCSMPGRHRAAATSPITPPAAPGRMPPRRCSRATAASGGRSNSDDGLTAFRRVPMRSRLRPRAADGWRSAWRAPACSASRFPAARTPRAALHANSRIGGPRLPWDGARTVLGRRALRALYDATSNYRMARETGFRSAGAAASLHPIPTDADAANCAAVTKPMLRNNYGAERWSCRSPVSISCCSALGRRAHRLAAAGPAGAGRARALGGAVPQGRGEPRITLTYPAMESSSAVVFLVTGEAKRDAVRARARRRRSLPAARLHSQGEIVWFLDRGGGPAHDAAHRGLCYDRRPALSGAGRARRLDRLAVPSALRFRCLFRVPARHAGKRPLADRAGGRGQRSAAAIATAR